MLFTKLELEVMALADIAEKDRTLFAVYADELQNLSGDTFGRLITEARKYKVALVAGHQFWKQLDASLRHAVLAVGSKALFRLHYHDAVELAGELAAGERNRFIKLLTRLGRGEAVARLGRKRPVLFTVPAHRAPKTSDEDVQKLKMQSAMRFTVSRSDIHKQTEAPPADAADHWRGNQMLTTAEVANYEPPKST